MLVAAKMTSLTMVHISAMRKGNNMKKATAIAAALTISTMMAVPVFANEMDGTSTGYGTGMYSPTATSTPGASPLTGDLTPMDGSFAGRGAISSPSTYSNTTGVGNYSTYGTTTGSTTDYTGYGGLGTNSYRPYATATDDKDMDWGWLGLLGLVGLAGLMGRNRDREVDRIK